LSTKSFRSQTEQTDENRGLFLFNMHKTPHFPSIRALFGRFYLTKAKKRDRIRAENQKGTDAFMKYTEPKILLILSATDALMASGESGGDNGGNTPGEGGWDGNGGYIELPLIPQN
jgi:hypothetical protein